MNFAGFGLAGFAWDALGPAQKLRLAEAFSDCTGGPCKDPVQQAG